MKMKNLAALPLALASLSVMSQELPYDCSYSSYESTQLELHALPDAIDAGWGYYGSQSWTSLGSFLWSLTSLTTGDSFKLSGPSYVLKGNSYRFKVDLDFLDLNDKLRDVSFYNSENGLLGNDRTNWDSNAYFNMDFSYTYGAALVWARSSSRCQAIPVMVQNAPKITYATTPSITGGKVSTKVSFELDQYSKAMVSNSDVRVTLTLKDELYLTSKSTSVSFSNGGMLRGSKTITATPHRGGGIYQVKVTINDGTYSTSRNIGWVRVPGDTTPPCPQCKPL
ncbi:MULTISPECIES: hypothetical protein [unclassified Pseudoalteromonas]|uniref:hypothetical protein n=1 Tax=unclassified Pseudoalteromonas TaxID=194690 RepID=UPI0030142BE1